MRVRHDDGGGEELCTVRGQAERMARVHWENENRLVFNGRKPWAVGNDSAMRQISTQISR